MAEVYRSVEATESFASPGRKPRANCPIGGCISDILPRIFVSAQKAMERDLAQTTLADVMGMVKVKRPG
jgi:DNA-binding IscR family transcriptional regulator